MSLPFALTPKRILLHLFLEWRPLQKAQHSFFFRPSLCVVLVAALRPLLWCCTWVGDTSPLFYSKALVRRPIQLFSWEGQFCPCKNLLPLGCQSECRSSPSCPSLLLRHKTLAFTRHAGFLLPKGYERDGHRKNSIFLFFTFEVEQSHI